MDCRVFAGSLAERFRVSSNAAIRLVTALATPGFVLSRLADRMSPRAAALAMAVLWAAWHLPIFLFPDSPYATWLGGVQLSSNVFWWVLAVIFLLIAASCSRSSRNFANLPG